MASDEPIIPHVNPNIPITLALSKTKSGDYSVRLKIAGVEFGCSTSSGGNYIHKRDAKTRARYIIRKFEYHGIPLNVTVDKKHY